MPDAPLALRPDSGSASGEFRRLFAIAGPLWAAQVASVALPLTDAVYMGRLDPVALAGGGLASTLLAAAILIGGSALGGMSPRVARAHVQGDRIELAAYVRHARWLGLAIAGVVIALALFAEPLLIAAGQGEDVARAASDYVITATLSVPFTLGCTIQRGLLAACGRARVVTAAWALAVPVNLALDHVLATGWGPIPPMGLHGIGAATSIVSLGVLGFLVVMGARAGLDDRSFWIGPRVARIGRDLRALGGPIALAVAAEAGIFALAGIAVGWFGSAGLAAHRVATLTAHFSFLAPLALSHAAAIRVAATEPLQGRRAAVRIPLLAALGWAIFAGVCVVIAAPWITSLMIPRDDPAFSVGVAMLQIVAAFQIVDALQSVAAGVLRGVGDTVSAMRWALLAYLVVAPATAAALALGAEMGGIGVWIGLSAGLGVAALGLVPIALRHAR